MTEKKRTREEVIKAGEYFGRTIADTLPNDIGRSNESGPGFSSGVTSPQFLRTGQGTRPGLGMYGPNQTRFTPLSFSATVTSKLALPGNKYRNYLMFQNNSTSDIFVGFGVNISDGNENGFAIASGGFYELDRTVPFNNIFIKGSLATPQNVLVIEGILTTE